MASNFPFISGEPFNLIWFVALPFIFISTGTSCSLKPFLFASVVFFMRNRGSCLLHYQSIQVSIAHTDWHRPCGVSSSYSLSYCLSLERLSRERPRVKPWIFCLPDIRSIPELLPFARNGAFQFHLNIFPVKNIVGGALRKRYPFLQKKHKHKGKRLDGLCKMGNNHIYYLKDPLVDFL